MELKKWLEGFRDLHERARQGPLSTEDQKSYEEGRNELARAFLSVQRISLQPGQIPRQTVRVARAVQVDIDVGAEHLRAVTRDVSAAGFAAMLEKTLDVDRSVKFTLRIAGPGPISGQARVIDMKSVNGRIRGSFSFNGLSVVEREQIEIFVFDAMLESLEV